MFVYKLNVNCIVYMNSVIILARLNGCIEHIHAEQATFFLYSLWLTYEQPTIINKSTTYIILFGCVNHCSYDCIRQSNLYVTWNRYGWTNIKQYMQECLEKREIFRIFMV